MMRESDKYIKAEIYAELINDMQAKILEFENKDPNRMNDEIRNINCQLSAARMESRIYIDEEHFQKWEDLLFLANTAMIRSTLFK